MKRTVLTTLIVLLLLAATAAVVWADKPVATDAEGNEIAWASSNCRKIQSGEILDSADNPLGVGYDQFGYNYQAHMFNGRYCDFDRVVGGPYCDVDLIMKWNDPWLANVDCDWNGELDRHFGFDTYIGSGAWLTNHMWGSYEENGAICEWDYFVKIVAAPDGAYVDDPYFTDEYGITHGTYYTADGTEIGFEEWGSFVVIQQVENDPCAGIEGLQYLSPDHAGFGGW